MRAQKARSHARGAYLNLDIYVCERSEQENKSDTFIIEKYICSYKKFALAILGPPPLNPSVKIYNLKNALWYFDFCVA